MEDTYTNEEQKIPDAVPIGTVARMLGVSVDTLRRWEADGKIESQRTLGGQRRFEIAEIERVKAEMSGVQR